MVLALGRAVSSVVSIAPTAGFVILGSLAATYATDFVREQGWHFDFKGSDALYPLASSVLMLSFMNNSITRGLSLGMIASSGTTAAKDYGLL